MQPTILSTKEPTRNSFWLGVGVLVEEVDWWCLRHVEACNNAIGSMIPALIVNNNDRTVVRCHSMTRQEILDFVYSDKVSAYANHENRDIIIVCP